ncbi:MAG: ribosomal protein arginine hydroxylase [Pseudomonadota bacterium]
MLYLPPKWAHDGIAEGECMTWSIGFRSPNEAELAAELVSGLAQEAVDLVGEAIYRDPKQVAVSHPGAIPQQLQDFAAQAVRKLVDQPQWLETLLGEYMTQAKSGVWFDGEGFDVSQGVALDRRTRMMYDPKQIYINGDSFRVGGADGRLLRQLADHRQLGGAQVARLSADALEALQDWANNGWLKPV